MTRANQDVRGRAHMWPKYTNNSEHMAETHTRPSSRSQLSGSVNISQCESTAEMKTREEMPVMPSSDNL